MVTRPRPPEREGDQFVNLVLPDEVCKGESLEVNDEHTRKTPHRHLFCGLTVVLTPGAVPACTRREGKVLALCPLELNIFDDMFAPRYLWRERYPKTSTVFLLLFFYFELLSIITD